MRGGSTHGAGEAQGYTLIQTREPDGRFKVEVSGTSISVVGSDDRQVMEEVNRLLQSNLHNGQVRG